MAILVDYGYVDSVLLKAAIIHDVLEDVPKFNHNTIMTVDYEGYGVYDLVKEVSRSPDETKAEFLTRIRESGSHNAKVLKVADRISNMITLGFVNNPAFVNRYTDETERYIFPIAEEVNKDMLKELRYLVESRRKFIADFRNVRPDMVKVDSVDFI
jgi:(p)ppGpp synthase/HD superfamily hydrolase